jgi:hypothetical protein
MPIVLFLFYCYFHHIMPESVIHFKGYHPRRPPYRMAEAAQQGQLVMLHCGLCHRRTNYLANDLVEVVGGDHPAQLPPFPCSRCRTTEWVQVKLRRVQPEDVGKLVVRRPGAAKVVRVWKSVLL